MSILKDHVIFCTDSIVESEKQRVIKELTDPTLNVRPRELIDINYVEKLNFAGNILHLVNKKGENCVVMSERAE